jgi:TonB family protein
MGGVRTGRLASWAIPGAAAFLSAVACGAISAAESLAAATPLSSLAGTTGVDEQLPPVGTGNLFSEEQISYCLAQGIRLEVIRSLVNRYKKAQVEDFNALTTDFNSRCESYRYLGSARESARAAVEAGRSKIEDDARVAYARRFPAEEKAAAPSRPVAEPKAAQPRVQEPPPPAVASAVAGADKTDRAAVAAASSPRETPPRMQQKPSPPAEPPAAATADKVDPVAAATPAPPPKVQPPAQQESAPPAATAAATAAEKVDRAQAPPSSPRSLPPSETPIRVPQESPAPPARAEPGRVDQAAASPPTPAAKPNTLPATKPDADVALERFVREVRRASWQIIDRSGYPEAARDKTWEGIAQIDVHFAAGGFIRRIVLGQSSGYAALDDRALAIARSLRFPDVPAELQSREFAVRFPVAFRLR